jgi:flagellar basal body-associated protein FliL
MADEQPANKELEKTSDVKKGKKGKMLKVILIPIILALQAGVAYFVVVNFLAANPDQPKQTKAKKEEKSAGQFYEIKDLVINPAGTLGRRFLVVEIGLETHDPKVLEEATSKNIWIRDSVIAFLTQKTSDELLDITKRKRLKAEILVRVNSSLTSGKFEKLYFTKYIMQ